MIPFPEISLKFRRGVNAENIGNGRSVLYALDTWTRLKDCGFTHGRLPVDMVTLDESTLVRLDTTIAAMINLGFVATLCPFGSGTLPSVDNIVTALDVLTKRFAPKYTPAQLGFEFRNEPNMFTADQWNAAIPIMLATIRANAPLHTIIIPPVLHDNIEQLVNLQLVKDPNVVYTVHFYEPAPLTQQGQNGTPINLNYVFPAPAGTAGSTGLYTLTKLNLRVKAAADWARTHNVPVMFGEFGCASDAPSVQRLAWVAATRKAIEDHPMHIVGWSWWGVDGRKFGLRPHNLLGAWDEPLLKILST